MNLMIAVPSHDHIPALFAYDLGQMMGFLGANYVGSDRPIKSVGLTFSTGTYVHSGRQTLAELAIEQGADYVLWLDSDMRFPKDLPIRLLKHRQDIVGINYSNKSVPPEFVAIKSVSPPEKLVTGPDSTGLEEVDAIGFGAVLMRGRVLRTLAEKHTATPLFWFDQREDGGLVGEDVFFCRVAREHGFEVMVDHDLSRDCGHVGVLEYKTDHPLAMMEEA